jgi:hypothetical protein
MSFISKVSFLYKLIQERISARMACSIRAPARQFDQSLDRDITT